jgi:glycosyltransferase involved in cell wall biosynthesis
VLEAAYFRLPVVATDVGLVRECVTDGQSAILVRPDAGELGDALGRLARDAELRRRLGDCGRRLVDARFLMPEIARRYESFYRRVLALT